MNPLFLKYFIITSAILIPACVVFGLMYFIVKNGINIACQKIINIADYLIDRISSDIKNVIHFLVDETDRIISSILSKSSQINALVGVGIIVVHPPQGDTQYACFCMLVGVNLLTVITKGGTSQLFNNIINKTSRVKKNENTKKQD
jgi:hypothetical protein